MNNFLPPRKMIPLPPLCHPDDLKYAAMLERAMKRMIQRGCEDHAAYFARNLTRLVRMRADN